MASVNLLLQYKMFKLNKFFAFFALFLGFYVSGIAINLNQVIHQSVKMNQLVLLKENKANNSAYPLQFFEPVDEREIDEDEQVRFNTTFYTECQNLATSFLPVIAEDIATLPKVFHQHYSFKSPRFIVYHSWKYYIS